MFEIYNTKISYLNLFLFFIIIVVSTKLYYSCCDYSGLVKKMNKISLTEIGE